jgi:adenosylcobinamide-GDP ribazoletransferase
LRVARPLATTAAAVGFLTRVPVGGSALGADDVARASVLFPAVGAAVGALVAVAALGFAAFLPTLVAAALAVAVEVIVVGGLHLDGLADTADALGAGSRERALEIMRDPVTGAFGTTAVVLDVVVKTAALAALLQGSRVLPAVVGAWALGRAVPLALALVLPYARDGAGLGRALTDGAGLARLATGVTLGVGLAFAVGGADAAPAVAGAATAALLVGFAARRVFGGVTGDVLGAAAEMGTTVALVGAVAAT